MSAHESLRDVALWLRASMAEADRWLPALLALDGPGLARELEARPELRTAGMMKRLLEVAHDALDGLPDRAHELTSVVVACAPRVAVPAMDATLLRQLQGQAWQEHARALFAIRRTGEARAAIAAARDLFECDPGSAWHVAMADLVDVPILHELGAVEEALQLARCAAAQFALHRDHEHYVDARILEMWVLWTGGDFAAAAEVGWEMEDAARDRADPMLTARIAERLARLDLRRGGDLSLSALDVFQDAGLRADAIRARWHLAQTVAARGRWPEAISELYQVHAGLLAIGAVIDAALVAAEVLEPLLAAGRLGEASLFTETLVIAFGKAGMPPHALEAFVDLRARAARGRLFPAHVAAVRRYFEDFPQQPDARFIPL